MLVARKRTLNPNVVRPKILNLPHVTTDDEGIISLDLKNWNLQFSGNDQVTLDFLEVPTASLHNMGHPSQPLLQTIRLSQIVDRGVEPPKAVGGKLQFASTQSIQDLNQVLHDQKQLWTRTREHLGVGAHTSDEINDYIRFPSCKISTLDELRVVLNFMVNYAGISFELTSDKTLTFHFHTDCPIERFYFPLRIAQVLGLWRKDGVEPIFLKKIYEGKAVIDRVDEGTEIPDKDGFWVEFYRRGVLPLPELEVLLPYHKDTFIWNDLTSSSFQMMMVGFDKMKQTFTGTELTKTLSVIPIQPEKVSLYYKPIFHSWKQMLTGVHSFIKLYFHDERGNKFKNVTLSLVLKFRKNTLF